MTEQNVTTQNGWKQSNAIWGILLIVGGLLFLLQNVGVFRGLTALVWVALFGAAGLFFLYLFLNNRTTSWWAAPCWVWLVLSFLAKLGHAFWSQWADRSFSPRLGLASSWSILLHPRTGGR